MFASASGLADSHIYILEEENMSNSYTTFISYTYNGKYPLTMDVDGEIIYFEYESLPYYL